MGEEMKVVMAFVISIGFDPNWWSRVWDVPSFDSNGLAQLVGSKESEWIDKSIVPIKHFVLVFLLM